MLLQLFPGAGIEVVRLRTDVGHQKRLALRLLAPLVVARGAQVAAVVARTYVVFVGGARRIHISVFLKLDAVALVGTRGVVGGEHPCHPVRQACFGIVAAHVARAVEQWGASHCAGKLLCLVRCGGHCGRLFGLCGSGTLRRDARHKPGTQHNYEDDGSQQGLLFSLSHIINVQNGL